VSPIADWAIDVIAANPVLAVLAPTVFVAVWCALNAISRQVERRRERRAEAHAIHQLELFANDPDNHQEEEPHA
jgi:hypothetical protein